MKQPLVPVDKLRSDLYELELRLDNCLDNRPKAAELRRLIDKKTDELIARDGYSTPLW